MFYNSRIMGLDLTFENCVSDMLSGNGVSYYRRIFVQHEQTNINLKKPVNFKIN